MTGPSGNRPSICPLRFRIASPRVPIDLGCASVNRNSWGGDPESLGANRSAYYPRDQSLFVYYHTCRVPRPVRVRVVYVIYGLNNAQLKLPFTNITCTS